MKNNIQDFANCVICKNTFVPMSNVQKICYSDNDRRILQQMYNEGETLKALGKRKNRKQ